MNAKIIIECTSRTNEHELRYIHYFRRDHNAPCSPSKLIHNHCSVPISPGYYSRPKRIRRQWLICKLFAGKQGALWSR